MRSVGARLITGATSAVLGLALAGLAAPSSRQSDYEIGPGDVLKVVVVGQAQMSSDLAVDTEGMMNFPILGKIKASEHTIAELERKVTTLLAEGILRRPQVTISIAEYGSQRVFVTGEVQRPGRYPLKADRTLLTLLGDIGALGANSGHEVIVIRPAMGGGTSSAPILPLNATDNPAEETTSASTKKHGDSKQQPSDDSEAPQQLSIPGLPFVAPGSEVLRVNLLEVQSGNPERNIALRAGDTVYFPKAAQVYVMGSVARPGPIRFQEGMTVLQALTLAGGVTERGSQGRTKVVRIVDGKKIEKKLKATEFVLPEDTLVVPERFF
jgi:polysaccharide export outer membrane protein